MVTCYLCSARRSTKTALHRLPKDPATRSAWISFCGLSEPPDVVKCLYLCSAHFMPSDYAEPQAKQLGHLLFLKPKTVPSILKPKRKKRQHMILSDPEAETNNESQSLQELMPRLPSTLSQFSDPEEELSQVLIEPELVSFENGESIALNPSLEESEQICQKEMVAEPSYVVIIKTSDTATPNIEKKSLLLAKSKIKDQASQIKILKQRNRRLLKKIETLEDLITQLKNK